MNLRSCKAGEVPLGTNWPAGAEAAKLKKFSDAGGSQIQWLSDVGRFTLFEREQYIKNGGK